MWCRVVPLDVGNRVGLRVSLLHFLEVLPWHDLEEEAENTGSELGAVLLSLAVEEMDDVHGVLTGGVEMELRTVEGGDWDVWVEEGDDLGFDAVEVLLFGLTLGDIEEEGVADLV